MPSTHQINFTPVLLSLIIGIGMVALMLATGQTFSTDGWRLATAASMLALGTSCIYFTVQNLQRARIMASSSPGTEYLITEGIFSFTRNPLCLGLLFTLFGLAKIFESSWGYAAPVLFFIFAHWLHIRPEEALLAARYGEQYQAYKSQVRRWV